VSPTAVSRCSGSRSGITGTTTGWAAAGSGPRARPMGAVTRSGLIGADSSGATPAVAAGLASSACHQATLDPGGSSRVVGSAQGALCGASGAGGWSQRSSWLRAAAMATGSVRPSWATTSQVSPGELAAQ
jgi:hypothetical protein